MLDNKIRLRLKAQRFFLLAASNTMSDISIGIRDYRFPLDSLCSENGLAGQLSISFSLKGNFMLAALCDDINKTVDYHALSLALERKLLSIGCFERALITEMAFSTVVNFSPLITDCYLKIVALCHGALIVEDNLLGLKH